MGAADDEVWELISEIDDAEGAPSAEHLGRLRAAAENAEVKKWQRRRAVAPYVADPRRCDPSSLQALMRVLVRSGDASAARIAELASSREASATVREEAVSALERVRT